MQHKKLYINKFGKKFKVEVYRVSFTTIRTYVKIQKRNDGLFKYKYLGEIDFDIMNFNSVEELVSLAVATLAKEYDKKHFINQRVEEFFNK